MSYKIDEIEGIGPAFSAKLAEANITTTEDLLSLCCSAKGRKDIEGKTGVSTTMLLKWSNQADLMRISGIGPEYAELLEAAGVDTVKELRNRRPDNLTAKMLEANEQKKLVRQPPAESIVTKWVETAKSTEPKITH